MIGAGLTLLLRAARLALAIVRANPEVSPDRAASAAVAITIEAGDHDPFLVAALFAPESGFDHRKVNPTTGACGLGQVLYSHDAATQTRRCRRVLRNARAGARAAVAKLDHATAFCARRGNLTPSCPIAGYVGGPAAVRALERGEPWIVATAGDVLSRAAAMRAIGGGV